jgi:FlaG/FlaF family flagellin (archaellin)
VWEGIVAEAGLTGSQAQASVTSLDQRRRRRGPVLGWLVAAAAVGVLAGATLTTVLGSTGSNDDAQVLATAPLEPVAESAYQGTAAVEQRGTESVLRVSVPDLPAVEDGYYEVWMATPDASTMVAIGTLNPGEEAVLTLPAGMDTAAFPLVDVSVEHFDGDAGHSAVSVVRGQLPA